LAIEVDAKLLTNPVKSTPVILPLALYSIGIAVVGLAAVGQRRKKAMEQTDDLQSVLQSISKRILDAARSHNAKSLVAALRAALPHVDDSKRAAIDSLLADLETNIYAPQSDGVGISSSATDRASQVAKSIVS
jgi:phosphopantetheine adenylyltransferase